MQLEHVLILHFFRIVSIVPFLVLSVLLILPRIWMRKLQPATLEIRVKQSTRHRPTLNTVPVSEKSLHPWSMF